MISKDIKKIWAWKEQRVIGEKKGDLSWEK